MTLSAYKISAVPGAEPKFEYTNGTIRCVHIFAPQRHVVLSFKCSHPKPFQCSILPRNEKTEQLIRNVGEDPAVKYMAPSNKENEAAVNNAEF